MTESVRLRTLEEIEMLAILKRVARFSGNRTNSARSLGINVRTLRNKLSIYASRGINVDSWGNVNETVNNGLCGVHRVEPHEEDTGQSRR